MANKGFCLQLVECCGGSDNDSGTTKGIEVIDNLNGNTNEDREKALSAYQGWELNEKINEINTKSVGAELLWKNNERTTFAGQTISIPELENYTLILICCISADNGIESTTMIPLNVKNCLYQMINHYPAFVSRQVRVLSQTSLSFTDGSKISSTGATTTNNTVQIPIRLYGIK